MKPKRFTSWILLVAGICGAATSGCRSRWKNDIDFHPQDRLFMERGYEIEEFMAVARAQEVDLSDGVSIGEAYRSAIDYIVQTWPGARYDAWLPTESSDSWRVNVYDMSKMGGSVVHALTISKVDGFVSEREPYDEDFWCPLDQMREYVKKSKTAEPGATDNLDGA